MTTDGSAVSAIGGTDDAREEEVDGRSDSDCGEGMSTSESEEAPVMVLERAPEVEATGVGSPSGLPCSILAMRASSCIMTLFNRSTSASEASRVASSLDRL